MPVTSWEDLKEQIGEDLALFAVFMSSLEASEILEGFVKMAKGACYLSQETLDLMYRDMITGIARDTVAKHLQPQKEPDLFAPKEIFWAGLDDLSDWLEITDDSQSSRYFSYLSRWDLDGHDWALEKPVPFGEFSHIQSD